MMTTLEKQIAKAQAQLRQARVHGDKLQIELAEEALNDLLDRLLAAQQK